MTDDKIKIKWLRFLAGCRKVSYGKGKIIFFEGEVPWCGYFIKTGLVKVYDLSDGGYEQVIYINSVDDIFPLPWLTHQRSTAVYYHEALTSCELYLFTREEYLNFIKEDAALVIHELGRAANKEFNLSLHLSAVLNSKANDKLLNTLYYLLRCYGVPVSPGKYSLNIKLTHQDIADLTGLRRETITVEFLKLKKLGVIYSKERPFYQLNAVLLNKMLNNKFSNSR